MSYSFFSEIALHARASVKSLSWCDDFLVDWIGRSRVYELDGTTRELYHKEHCFAWDGVVVSPSKRFQILYTRTGTTALVLQDYASRRQLSRPHTYADRYLYPITIAQLKDGREVLIHCPDDFATLEIEDLLTGERLTKSKTRKGADNLFHSHLTVSPGGKWLLNHGWVWHPVFLPRIYDLEEAVANPETLDEGKDLCDDWEITNTSFISDHELFVATSDEFLGDEPDPEDLIGPNTVCRMDLESFEITAGVALPHPPGILAALNRRFVLSFYQHPRLIDMEKGVVVHQWSDLDTGKEKNPIDPPKDAPPFAVDRDNTRFAVAAGKTIHVISLNLEQLTKN